METNPLVGAAVSTKAEMLELKLEGCFGNSLREWRSIEAIRAENYVGGLVVRYLTPGSPWHSQQPSVDAAEKWVRECMKKGALRKEFFFNELAVPPGSYGDGRMFQGEIARCSAGWRLTYCFKDVIMRTAMRAENALHYEGLWAPHLLRQWFDPSSYEDFIALFDIWPDAVVEFTVFQGAVGHVVGRHTNFGRCVVFWEVREY